MIPFIVGGETDIFKYLTGTLNFTNTEHGFIILTTDIFKERF